MFAIFILVVGQVDMLHRPSVAQVIVFWQHRDMAEKSLSHRVLYDPAFTAVARLFRYHELPVEEARKKALELTKQFPLESLHEVDRELLEHDRENGVVRLSAAAKKACWQLLGPTPEEWDSFYEGVANPPPNPYRQATAKTDTPTPEEAADKESEPASEVELLRSLHGRKLRQLLAAQHDLYQDYPPGDPTHEEAVRGMDVIESEMRRRGNKIPGRPVLRERYEPGTGSRQLTEDKQWLPSEFTTGEFRAAPSQRLRALLDMCQYELTRCGPGTVTHQEARRDIGLIERELQRRSAGNA